MVKELVTADIHDDLRLYKAVDAFLGAEKVDRWFLTGDFSNGVQPQVLEQMVAQAQKDPKVTAAFDGAKKGMSTMKALEAKETAGTLSEADKAAAEDAMRRIKEAQAIETQLLAVEAQRRYQPHNKVIGAITGKHGIKAYGVAGNHDSAPIYDFLSNVKFLEATQALNDEGTIGCPHTTEDNDRFAGSAEFAINPMDAMTLEESPVWNAYKDKKVSLVVAHKEATPVKDKFPSGVGLAEIVKKNGCPQYVGHFHQAYIRVDHDGNVIFNPGTTHMYEVTRNGTEIEKVRIYRLPYRNHVHKQMAD